MEKLVNYREVMSFYNGKRVLITGHTGFKGSWMCSILLKAGAIVTGYALEPPTKPALYELSNLNSNMDSIIGDVRDIELLRQTFERAQPEVVFHLAAQPIVLTGYRDPVGTYETNVMGTVNILECCREFSSVKSVLNVTTDKVYENKEWAWGYRENEPLDGFDPYSNSKSCSELVTHCYKNSYFDAQKIAVSTARAGNVIGGGDFADNRIVPDCVRAAVKRENISVRNPYSTRPYQHVLEPLFAYLMIAKRQYEDISLSGYYNVGPDEIDCVTTGELVDSFCNAWGADISWENRAPADAPHEANFLKLDCSKLKATFGWKPTWAVKTAVQKTCDWSKAWSEKENISAVMAAQIEEYVIGAEYARSEV